MLLNLCNQNLVIIFLRNFKYAPYTFNPFFDIKNWPRKFFAFYFDWFDISCVYI